MNSLPQVEAWGDGVMLPLPLPPAKIAGSFQEERISPCPFIQALPIWSGILPSFD